MLAVSEDSRDPRDTCDSRDALLDARATHTEGLVDALIDASQSRAAAITSRAASWVQNPHLTVTERRETASAAAAGFEAEARAAEANIEIERAYIADIDARLRYLT